MKAPSAFSVPRSREAAKRDVFDWLMGRVRAAATTAVAKGIPATAFRAAWEPSEPDVLLASEQVFSPAELTVLAEAAGSIAIGARILAASLMGGPAAAASEVLAAAGSPRAPTVLTQVAIAELGATSLLPAAAVVGRWCVQIRAAGMVGAIVHNAMRAVGLRTVNDLAAQALLQPKLGHILLQRAVTDPKSPILAELARQIVALGAASSVQATSGRKRQ